MKYFFGKTKLIISDEKYWILSGEINGMILAQPDDAISGMESVFKEKK